MTFVPVADDSGIAASHRVCSALKIGDCHPRE
jgi:hypothetical protein